MDHLIKTAVNGRRFWDPKPGTVLWKLTTTNKSHRRGAAISLVLTVVLAALFFAFRLPIWVLCPAAFIGCLAGLLLWVKSAGDTIDTHTALVSVAISLIWAILGGFRFLTGYPLEDLLALRLVTAQAVVSIAWLITGWLSQAKWTQDFKNGMGYTTLGLAALVLLGLLGLIGLQIGTYFLGVSST